MSDGLFFGKGGALFCGASSSGMVVSPGTMFLIGRGRWKGKRKAKQKCAGLKERFLPVFLARCAVRTFSLEKHAQKSARGVVGILFYRLNKRGRQQGSIRSRECLKRAGSQE